MKPLIRSIQELAAFWVRLKLAVARPELPVKDLDSLTIFEFFAHLREAQKTPKQ